jgi:hypothetical protein
MIGDLYEGGITYARSQDRKASQSRHRAEYYDRLAEGARVLADINVHAPKKTGKYREDTRNWREWRDLKRLYNDVGETLPRTAVIGGSLMADPFFGMLVAAILSTGDMSREIRKYEKKTGKQVSEYRRATIPVMMGYVNAAIEKTGLDKFLEYGSLQRHKLMGMLIKMAIEPTQNIIQEGLKILAEWGVTGRKAEDILRRLCQAVWEGSGVGVTKSLRVKNMRSMNGTQPHPRIQDTPLKKATNEKYKPVGNNQNGGNTKPGGKIE